MTRLLAFLIGLAVTNLVLIAFGWFTPITALVAAVVNLVVTGWFVTRANPHRRARPHR